MVGVLQCCFVFQQDSLLIVARRFLLIAQVMTANFGFYFTLMER